MSAWADVVGAGFARPGGREDAIDGIVPAAVVRPGSVEEVQAVVRRGAALVVSGRGAHLDVGGLPARLDALVCMDRLSRLLDHQAADMTVTVEAGCTLADLDATLARAGQWLPLDPPRPEDTTVGGLVAANLAGPLRASQGTVRDLLIGITVVGADGARVRGGGRVVKNVAGYDLPKLHVGALGTLGLIVEATFKVRPRPAHETAAILVAANPGEAAAHALAVRDALDPLWLEAGHLGDVTGAAVGLAGIPAEIAAARRTVEAVARSRRTELRWIEDGTVVRRKLAVFAAEPAAAVLRASVLPGDVGWAMARIGAFASGAPALAHATNGVVRARLADVASVPRVVVALRPEIAARGGFLVVERAIPAVKHAVDVWGDAGEGLPLMRRVKDAFDPQRILAPGRYVGGL